MAETDQTHIKVMCIF